MKNRSFNFTKMLSLISSIASMSLTTILVLTTLVVSVLAVAALNPSIHVLRPVVSADEIQPEVVEGKPTVKWQVFQDGEYGIRFQYPAAWSVQEAEIADSGDDVPIERVILFAPQGWEGIVAPVAVEIGLGSPEELERVWPGLVAAQSSTVTAVGYNVLVWQSPSDEGFCVFEHPVASKLRVAFRDSVGEEEIVSRMLDTFEFTLIHPLVPGRPGAQ